MVRILLLLFVSIFFSYAQTKKPVVIEADALRYDKKAQTAVYEGNVTVKSDDFRLFSEKLEIFLDERGDIKKIIAVGNVRFYKGNRKGKSKRAEYYRNKNLIVLKGNAELQQDNNIIEGMRLYIIWIQKKLRL
ncbi:MAG: lipopolysaccharide transport periplasmic protein LptA [Persephonella sp.]|nr:lipopolysaccharide transport periplasmic protein LptA [Persephonella sp.]